MRIFKGTVIVGTLLLLALAVQPVLASCGAAAVLGTAASLTTKSYVHTGGYFVPQYYNNYVFAYNPPWSPNFAGQWWALGTGDPAPGAGADSSTWSDVVSRWGYFYGPGASYGSYFPGEIAGGWGQSAEIDGCISDAGASACTCFALSDDDGSNTSLALLGSTANGNLDTFYDQPGTDGAGNAGPIILLPLVAPAVTNTVKNGDGVDVTIDVAMPTGIYMKDGCDCGAGMSYNIVAIELPQGTGPPTTRDPAAWTTISTAPTAVGTPGTATATCTSSADVELYVSYELIYDTP